MPNVMIKTFLVTQTGRGNIQHHLFSLTVQKTSISSSGGKMRARALLATAPMREMRSPRSGMAAAIAAVGREFQLHSAFQ